MEQKKLKPGDWVLLNEEEYELQRNLIKPRTYYTVADVQSDGWFSLVGIWNPWASIPRLFWFHPNYFTKVDEFVVRIKQLTS